MLHAKATNRRTWSARRTHLCVALLAVIALVLRLYQLAGPVLRWDEGWSLAHASLAWGDLWRVATEEWHPPAYVALLKLWLAAGRSAWSIRFLSVLSGALAVPLTYSVARAWSGRARTALLAAGFAATWPLLVYYGQVARMYALSSLAVLAAAWFMLRNEEGPLRCAQGRGSWRDDLGLVLSAALALYSLYHAALVLAGLWLYAAIAQPRRLPRLFALGLAALALYVPWLLAALGTVQARAGAGAQASTSVLGLLGPALQGLAFTYGARPWAAAALALVLAGGLLVGRLSGDEAKRLLLPLLVVVLSLAGAIYSAGVYWFAVRHLVPAAPFLGLALAWALDRLAQRAWPLLPVALLALAVAYWPTCTGVVYAKMLEVTDPFDPAEDYRYLAERTGPNDLVYFNAVARAGWYETLRAPNSAPWSYTMRWDPIIEPMERIAARIGHDSARHHRLWFALYKGSYGPNADLVAWLNDNLYPAGGEWQGEMLYLAYVAPGEGWASTVLDERFEGGIRLTGARWTPSVRPGGAAALEFTWGAERPLGGSYKVFVHITDEAGRVVAQHDGIPDAERQPTQGWTPGATVRDRHGLLLPASAPAELRIRVGLYDANTGRRLRLEDGGDAVELCSVRVQ